MEDILPLDPVAAETARIGIVADFENPAAYVAGMARQEILDVEAIDRRAPVKAEFRAERAGRGESAMPKEAASDGAKRAPHPKGCRGRPIVSHFIPFIQHGCQGGALSAADISAIYTA
jgi:hypothetical protein